VLSLGRCRLTRLGLDRLDGGVDAERLDDAQNLGADGGVDLNAPDRDAPLRTVVRASAVARVAPNIAAVVHVQLAPAVAAAEQSGQQHLTVAHGAFHNGAAFAHGIVRDHALIALELVPADVALVMIFDQNIAFIDRATYATPHALAAVLDTYGSDAKSASISTRRDCRNASEIVGDWHTLCSAADSASIHAGRQASEPSGCKMTAISTLCVTRRLLTMTASPTCGW